MRQEPPLDDRSSPAVGWGSALTREPTSQLGLGAEAFGTGLISEEVSRAGNSRLLAGIGWELRLVPVARPDRARNGACGKTSQRPGRPPLALVRDREERMRP